MRGLFFLMMPVLLFSCEEEDVVDDSIADYRDEFVGNYAGWRHSSNWLMGQPTIVTYDGSDTYTVVAVGDSFISLNGSDSIPIGPDGEFSQFSGGSSFFSIQFSAPDSLHVTNSSGGLGGGSTTNFNGKKN
jgi:hypothetical protein